MKILNVSLIIIIILFITATSQTTNEDSIMNANSLNNTKPFIFDSDSFFVKLTCNSKIYHSDDSFIVKFGSLIGAIIGSLFAALIAICSIRKTNKNNIALEQEKYNVQMKISENIYCGLLFTIYSELMAHDKIYKNVLKEMDMFIEYFQKNLKIPVERIISEFPLPFLKTCITKSLDFPKFNTKNLVSISHYLNVLESVNRELNMNSIRSLIDGDGDRDPAYLTSMIQGYFQEVRKILIKLSELREHIKNENIKIIDSYPQSDVEFEGLKIGILDKY